MLPVPALIPDCGELRMSRDHNQLRRGCWAPPEVQHKRQNAKPQAEHGWQEVGLGELSCKGKGNPKSISCSQLGMARDLHSFRPWTGRDQR